MVSKKHGWLGWYYRLFNFIAQKRIQKKDVDLREVHSFLVSILVAGPVIILYTLNFCFNTENKILSSIGIAATIIHFISPLLYLISSRSLLISIIVLSNASIFLSTFLFQDGGINNPAVIWFAIFPVFIGTICGRKTVISSAMISFTIILTFAILPHFGIRFEETITSEGKELNRMILIFGFLILNTAMIFVYTSIRQKTEEELYRQSSRADDLFRVLFHDLANPLGRMSIGLSIAKRAMPDLTHRGIEIASQASENMMEITKNFRKMYAISRGKANIDRRPSSLKSAFDSLKEAFKNDLEKKRISLHLNQEDDQDVYLLVDEASFRAQVLGNILSNALKFSYEGSHIWIKSYSVSEDVFAVEIRDEGIGIPETLNNHLFDLNKKTTRPGTNGDTGTGLGLHIVRSFIDAYDGDISIHSSEGKEGLPSGTTVKLLLRGEKRST